MPGKLEHHRHLKRLRAIRHAIDKLIARIETDPDHIEFYDGEIKSIFEAGEHEAVHHCTEDDNRIIDLILLEMGTELWHAVTMTTLDTE